MRCQTHIQQALDFFYDLGREYPQVLGAIVSAVLIVAAMAFFGFLIGSMADHAATLAQ